MVRYIKQRLWTLLTGSQIFFATTASAEMFNWVGSTTNYLENQLLFISINWKPLKPAIQLPKKMGLSYVFQVVMSFPVIFQHLSPTSSLVSATPSPQGFLRPVATFGDVTEKSTPEPLAEPFKGAAGGGWIPLFEVPLLTFCV